MGGKDKIMSYKKNEFRKTSIARNESYEGEPLEIQIERMISNGEGLEVGKEMIFTERKDGVLPGYNIRTDKWKVANEAGEKLYGLGLSEREKNIEKRGKVIDINGKAESTQDDTGKP